MFLKWEVGGNSCHENSSAVCTPTCVSSNVIEYGISSFTCACLVYLLVSSSNVIQYKISSFTCACLVYLLVSSSNVIQYKISSFTCACLVKYVEILQGLKLVFLMHVVFGQDLFKLCACHIHTAPSVNMINSFPNNKF